LENMELRQLKCFVAIAEELHFRKAAERVGLAQTALSAQIRKLEDELGFPLLFRTTRHVSLTQAGAVFLGEVREVLARLDRGVEEAREANRSGLNRLRIGGIDAALVWFLPPVIEEFKRRHPTVHLPLTEVTASVHQVQELLRHHVDVAFFRPPTSEEGIAWELLFEEDPYVAIPEDHDLAAKADVSVEDILDEMIIGYPKHARPYLHAMIADSFEQVNAKPKIDLEVLDKSTLLKLVSQGMGIGVVPEWSTLSPVPGVTFKRYASAFKPLQFGVAWRQSDKSRTLQEFLEVVRTQAAETERLLRA
jgi:DNA-binding transcriptional LysR family regulator